MQLFHVSETPYITCFTPRIDDNGASVVWAIDEAHLSNYLLPRECPRVCVRATSSASAGETSRWLGASAHTIYVEAAWRERIAETRLFVYEFARNGFECVDANAGYFQSRLAQSPRRVAALSDLPTALRERGVALRYVESLWPLQDAVVTSGLSFSCIRMRNALPRS
jgi:hypothetical protein